MRKENEMRIANKLIMVLTVIIVSTSLLLSNAYCLTGINNIVRDENGASENDISNSNGTDEDRTITNADRDAAYVILMEHINSLKAMYDLSPGAVSRMNDVAYEANVYIANNALKYSQLQDYIQTVKESLTASVGDAALVSSTKEFLFLSNDVGISAGASGGSCTINLSVVNFGKEAIDNVIITPAVSNNPKEWPFVIRTASDARLIDRIPVSTSVETSLLAKKVVGWTFTVSKDAYTGVYPIKFNVQYYRNGNIEQTQLTTFASITGLQSNGMLIDTDSSTSKTSTPRIIVTGFSTDPEEVNAGDTFTLNIDVQNTSTSEKVSNIQFDLKADSEKTDEGDVTGYEAFLPTSGSSTIYVDSIEPKGEKTISIEMTSRSDLAQKPYVITLKALYEDGANNSFEANSNISIPVKQKARIDTSDPEISPDYIGVGESSNVMMEIYNLGKTTLYNVKVSFEDGNLEGGNGFVGKIAPGETGYVDVMVNGAADNEDSGICVMTITYEDEAGNPDTLEKEIPLTVYDMGDMEGDMEYMEGDMEYMDGDYEMEGRNYTRIIVVVIVVVVIAAIVTLIIILKKRKKKKEREKELEELELDLSDINNAGNSISNVDETDINSYDNNEE